MILALGDLEVLASKCKFSRCSESTASAKETEFNPTNFSFAKFYCSEARGAYLPTVVALAQAFDDRIASKLELHTSIQI